MTQRTLTPPSRTLILLFSLWWQFLEFTLLTTFIYNELAKKFGFFHKLLWKYPNDFFFFFLANPITYSIGNYINHVSGVEPGGLRAGASLLVSESGSWGKWWSTGGRKWVPEPLTLGPRSPGSWCQPAGGQGWVLGQLAAQRVLWQLACLWVGLCPSPTCCSTAFTSTSVLMVKY